MLRSITKRHCFKTECPRRQKARCYRQERTIDIKGRPGPGQSADPGRPLMLLCRVNSVYHPALMAFKATLPGRGRSPARTLLRDWTRAGASPARTLYGFARSFVAGYGRGLPPPWSRLTVRFRPLLRSRVRAGLAPALVAPHRTVSPAPSEQGTGGACPRPGRAPPLKFAPMGACPALESRAMSLPWLFHWSLVLQQVDI